MIVVFRDYRGICGVSPNVRVFFFFPPEKGVRIGLNIVKPNGAGPVSIACGVFRDGFRSLTGGLVFFVPLKKSTEQKVAPKACPFARVRCVPRRSGR